MAEIHDIWRLRNAGRLEEANSLFHQFCQKWQICALSPLTLAEQLKEVELSDETSIDVLCLAASFLRRQAPLERSQELLQQAKDTYPGAELHCQWLYQRGLNALHQCQHFQAMQDFFAARKLARSQQEYFNTWIDGIVCLEALDLPYLEHLAELRAEIDPVADESWATTIVGQLRALEIREHYRRVELESLHRFEEHADLDDQSTYHLAWIASLPYNSLNLSPALESRLVTNATRVPTEYLAEFRLGTINNIGSDEEGRDHLKTSEVIERFYLWTWRWLMSPSSFRARQLVHCKLMIDQMLGGQITPEDHLMLGNSLRWLGLFMDTPSAIMFELLSVVEVDQRQPALSLSYESDLLDYLYAKREGNTDAQAASLARLQANHLHGHSSFRMWEIIDDLIQGSSSAKFKILVEALRDLWPQPSEKKMRVSITTGLIEFTRGENKESVRSTQLARLLHLCAHRDTVTALDIMSHCFEIRSFSPEIHISKISSLLTRANQLLYGLMGFARRDTLIYVTQRDGEMQILGGTPQHLSLMAVAERTALLHHTPERLPAAVLPGRAPNLRRLLHATDWISRPQVEELFGLTRSTVLRRLKEWEEQGQCIKRGVGKATRYKFREDFLKGRSTRPVGMSSPLSRG